MPLPTLNQHGDVPRGFRYELHACGSCPNVHILFRDLDGVAVFQATMSTDQVRGMLEFVEAIKL